MQADLLDRISAINPLPDDLPAPAIASLAALRERGEPPARRPPTRARSAVAKRAALALPIAAAILALALLGRGGRQFDVAAAVYKATLAGNGVKYMFLEGEAGARRIRYQRWSTSEPLRERSVEVGPSGTVELVSGAGLESAWSTEHPGKILRVHGSAPVSTWDPVRVIQQAYRAGRLHVLGKTTIGARAAYRAEVESLHGSPGSTVIVDAHTFMPIEMVYHRPGGGPPTLEVHVRSYEELPATKANVALVRLAHHPGARVVSVTRASGH
ncbi:MAG TPA: hypothetical protein VHT27_08105 [Solirubrobacteraceae bacterium]|jgi:hypothetical protein|nr:hypothetical protein [Solirubrobacteraceae bacterium]